MNSSHEPRPPLQPPRPEWGDEFRPESKLKRPLQPVRVRYTQAWLYFLLAACLVVAWWGPGRMVLHQYLHRPVKTGVPRDAYAFVTLAYSGVSDQTNDVSLTRFREQFQALRTHGYTPIALNDVEELLHDGKPLPRKAILLTFDQSRKSSYFDVRSILSRHNWNAVMFIWTLPIEQEDPSSLRWPYIRYMLRSRLWEIGAQGHNGFEQVPADAAGHQGNFLTTPQWLARDHRYETMEEFKNRIVKDHEQCLQLIRDHVGVKPIAFAYPYGDFGQYESRALLTRRINLDFVGRYYAFGFVSANKALNSRFSDARCLNRLLVKPEWSADDLINRLEKSWPVQAGYADLRTVAVPSAWIVDWGAMALQPGEIGLCAPTNVTGAKMWLSGSDLCRDFHVRLSFRLLGGQFGIYVRASPNEESYVYLGMDGAGDVWLRQKHAGSEPFTLASARSALMTNTVHDLELFVRQKLLFASLDGRSLFKETAVMRGEPSPGMFGLSVWDPDKGRARAGMTRFALENQKPTMAQWNPPEIKPPDLTHWIQKNAYRLTHLSPPWLRITPQGLVQTASWDPELFRMLAKAYCLELLPNIKFENEHCLEEISPSNLADKVKSLRLEGVTVNVSELNSSTAMAQLTKWMQRCDQAMEQQHLPWAVELPAMLERPALLPAMLAMVPNLHLAVGPDSPLLSPDARFTNTMIKVESVPLPSEVDLSLYYEITGLGTSDGKLTKEARAELLRQDGFNAFEAGDYQKAITLWTQWLNQDPGNEEPLMLIGDAWLRMDDTAQALSFYEKSLDVNPGQIGLAIRRARLLDNLGKSEEAMQALNLYARVFPDSVPIVLAQADWLIRHNRRREADGLVRRVLERDPNDITALTMLHGLLETPAERYANMRRMTDIASQPVMQYVLGEAILNNELLALPESCMLLNLANRIVRETSDDRLRSVYQKMLPRAEAVSESFVEGKPSSSWTIWGAEFPPEEGQMRLGARKTQQEASLRLKGSDTLHNGFVEVTIDEVKGFLWLYARRSVNDMIRFGFDQTGNAYLQVWRHSRLVSNEVRPWLKPRGPVLLRLELKGDGAAGFVNGQPLFSVPATIPPDMVYGWWGMAPYSPLPGKAYTTLHSLSGGPLPVQIAVLADAPNTMPEDMLLEAFKPYTRTLSVVAPPWLSQGPDGRLQKTMGPNEMTVRMFCSYHRIRLLPLIQMEFEETIGADLLKKTADELRVRGFVLLPTRMPSDAWFAQLTRQLEASPLDILVVAPDMKKGVAKVREVNLGIGIFPGPDKTRTILIEPFESEAEEETPLHFGWPLAQDRILWM
ncbi:MAG: polysaccharide deacetylase family protein [Lentisphaerae bacterium]|nr:polysaccharide deacetylase family protein [Lentisphaerota bacterium]